MSAQANSSSTINDPKLRSRVKLLGKLLGNVLIKHEDPKVLRSVEKLRKGFIQLRRQDDEQTRQQMIRLIDKLEPEIIEQVIRAFSIYFSLVNIAEEDHFHRERRRRVLKLGDIDQAEIDRESAYHLLDNFWLELVDQPDHLLPGLLIILPA